MISSELPEILRLSHRIAVMCEGRLTGDSASAAPRQEEIMQLATQRGEPADRTPNKPAKEAGQMSATVVQCERLVRRQVLPAPSTRLLAFASLIALIVVFSSPRPTSCRPTTSSPSCRPPRSTACWRSPCTFVIITGGIDLSVGTLMTFCAVIAGVVLTYLGLPLGLGVLAAILAGALLRLGHRAPSSPS